MNKESKRKRIFAIDDEPEICAYITRVITTKTNHEVVSFGNPQKALEEFKRTGAHLVISDITMPEMDGITLLGRIKEVCPETEVILLTGRASVKSAIHAIAYRAYDYIEKPVAHDRLLQTVANALTRQEMSTELATTINKVVALTKVQRQRLRDQVVHVTPLERVAMGAVMANIFKATVLDQLTPARSAIDALVAAAAGKVPHVEAVHTAIDALTRSIDELSARLGTFELNRVGCDLVTIVNDEIAGYSGLFSNVAIPTEAPSTPIQVNADQQALSTALGHVIENAMQAIERNGTIRVRVSKADRLATVSVMDEGPGFPEEVLKDSPISFVPGGPGATRWLGLAMAQLIVTKHGGSIELANRKSGGAQTSLTIPCSR